MHNYKKLVVWQESIDLVESIYKLTSRFPKVEKFGLISQIQRAAVSIPSNIAEGAGRNSRGEFRQFLGIAIGSLNEVETQLIIANRLQFVTNEEFFQIQSKLELNTRRIHSLIKSLK